jgi:hypothetical protein
MYYIQGDRMKQLLIIAVLAALVSSCASKPKTIDDALLVDKTPEQAAKLAQLEDQIIAKNAEVSASLKELDAAKQQQVADKGALSIMEKELVLAEEKVKVARSTKDDTALADAQKEQRATERKITIQRRKTELAAATEDKRRNQYEIAAGELNVLVAELNFEKAKIAKAYQLKTLAEKGENKETPKEKSFFDVFRKDDKGIIDDESYKTFLTRQRDILENRVRDRRIKDDNLSKAQRDYDAALKTEAK